MGFTFSCIILTFNEEKTIGKILFQLAYYTKIANLEIIVIDSESTDRTCNIVEEYQDKISDLRLIHIKKSEFNFSNTRNYAVTLAKGRFICFLSGDALPKSRRIFTYLYHDFKINNKVVAVFGRQIPYKGGSVIQNIEYMCRFKQLDQYVGKNGLLIQSLDDPFISYSKENIFLWSYLFNTFACYRRSFLVKYPFPKTDYKEDFLLGRLIIEKGYTKIYDRRCTVIHSHREGILSYYRKQFEEISILHSKFRGKVKLNISCKIKTILSSKFSLIEKFFYLLLLLFYYLIKIVASISFSYSKFLK